MRLAIFSLIAAFTCVPILAAADSPGPAPTIASAPAAPYTDPTYGFSIDPPHFDAAEDSPSIAVVFTGPPRDAFAASINILVDPAHTTRKEYLDASLESLRKSSTKFISNKDTTVGGYEGESFDYEAVRNARELHFLQLMVVTPDKVYVITCTATVESFADYLPEFQKCIDSFRPPAVPPAK